MELGGPDVPLLTQHNGELLRALETLSAQMLHLDQREHDLVSFDAGNFKALRAQELRMAAETAAEKVLKTGVPYAFPPMNSRERRLLHLAFKEMEGVETASSGEGQDRFLAVYPAGKTHLPVNAPVRPRRIWAAVICAVRRFNISRCAGDLVQPALAKTLVRIRGSAVRAPIEPRPFGFRRGTSYTC